MWTNDDELFALMRSRLFPAVIGDILDTMGLLKQFLSPTICPLRSDLVIVGRAMPVLETNCFSASEPNGQFSYGGYAQDQGPRGKVVDFRVAVEISGVRIAPGDIVFGDLDGVLVIPRHAQEEAIRKALEKSSTENKVRLAIQRGMSTVDAFKTFGVM